MWANISDLIILALTLAAVNLVAAKATVTLDSYLAELEGKQAALEKEFASLAKKFYFDPQEKAQKELMKSDQVNAYKLREISNLYSVVEYAKYAVRRRANQVVGDILRKEFNHKLEDSKLTLDADLSAILLDRIELRALVDGYKATSSTWKELYLRMPRKGQAPEPVESLVREIFIQRSAFGQLANDVNERLLEKMKNYCAKMGLSLKAARIILLPIDRLIDIAMGCQECSNLFETDEEAYFTYPMFSDWWKVDDLAEKIVDLELVKLIRKNRLETSGHLRDLNEDEIDKVTEEDIDGLHEDYTDM